MTSFRDDLIGSQHTSETGPAAALHTKYICFGHLFALVVQLPVCSPSHHIVLRNFDVEFWQHVIMAATMSKITLIIIFSFKKKKDIIDF